MPQKPPDFVQLIAALEAENVSYVVIGGMAMVLHGCSHVTMDADFAVAPNPENGQALVRALAPFEPIPSHLSPNVQFVWDERSFRGAVISLNTKVGDVDVLLTLPGVDSFDGLRTRAAERFVGGHTVWIASVDDLIKMKTAADRPHDRQHILQLEAIRKLRS